MDPVIIRQPGVDNSAAGRRDLIVSPETAWYALVLILFSASAVTDTGSKSFHCALVSHWNILNQLMILKMLFIRIIHIIAIMWIISIIHIIAFISIMYD
jgi:hypothetical protein